MTTCPHCHRAIISPSSRNCAICPVILEHVNTRLQRRYRIGGATGRLIHACHTWASKDPDEAVDACKSVVNWLHDGWGDSDMDKYLRPSTMFRMSNFQLYWEDIQAGSNPPGKRR